MTIVTGKYFKMWGFNLISVILLTILDNLVNSYVINCGSDFNSAAVPRDHPQTDVGSFMVYQSFQTIKDREPIRDVFVYWREINEADHCGASFEYFITCSPNTTANLYSRIPAQRSYTNYVKFENLSTNIGYVFSVYASNEHGLSLEHSTINVPSEQDRNPKKLSLTKALIDHDIFILSWNNDHHESNYDYTLFWCEKNPNRPYECKGYINWTHVPGTYSSYILPIKDPKRKYYNFAISENNELINQTNQINIRSSGMKFETCSLLSDNTLGRIEYVHIHYITSTSIEMHWIFECSDTVDGVIGYQLEYCTSFSKQSFQCTGSITKKYIDLQSRNKKNPDYNITMYGDITVLVMEGFQPATNYILTIIANSIVGLGVPNDPLFVTTSKMD